jgi:ABC-2 type transport system ATP-binding protein
MLELNGVTKLYGTVIGVNDVTLQLPPGAYGLLGPNGAGKTTLLNLITGQLRPTKGHVRVFGGNPWNNHRLFRRLGICPAQELLYGNVSGLEWVEYLMVLQGFTRAEAARRAEEALVRVGMGHAMRRPIGSYSRGMRQRTKLAQAIAHDPELLILDEPFDGLDPIGRHDFTQLLRTWITDRSLILASHILHEVEAICPSFLLILNGRLLAFGSAEEVQYLLAGVPAELTVVCDRPNTLAALCWQEELADTVRCENAQQLRISTHRPAELAQRLPQWAIEHGILLHEVRTPEDALQTLFNSLIQLHRGERL